MKNLKAIMLGLNLALISFVSLGQSADMGVNMVTLSSGIVEQGDSIAINISAENLGGDPYPTGSLTILVSAPNNARITGLRTDSGAANDSRWSVLSVSNESTANAVRFINSGGPLNAYDAHQFYVNIVGVTVSDPTFFTYSANIVGTFGTIGAALAGNQQTSNDNSGSSLMVMSPSNPAPVELVGINATWTGEKDALVNWLVASEFDNEIFEVERSTDTKNFIKLGEVKSIGNHSSEHLYSFLDNETGDLEADDFFYRVKQLDFDGTSTYSSIVKLSRSITGRTESSFTLYPNPVVSNLFVKFDSEEKFEESSLIQILDVNGRVVMEKNVGVALGNKQVSINLEGLSSGVYNIMYSKPKSSVVESLQFIKQ